MSTEEEYKKKIRQNINFFKFVQQNIFSKATPDDIYKLHTIGERIFPLEDLNEQLSECGYSEKNMNELIDLQMNCSILWSELFKKDKSEYYLKF